MIDVANIFKKKNEKAIPADVLREYNKHRPLGPQKRVCYAPFTSIYFGHHGRAIACCYNRTYTLGEYPAMSINEIWNGEKANQLREYIKNNDLTLGCLSCEQQIRAGNYDATKAKQYDQHKLNSNGYPSVMEFELSNTCNLECEMCSGDFSSLIRAKREKLPPVKDSYDMEFVRQLEEYIPYLEEMKFYGGEPFLIELYYEIWERVMELNPKIRLSVQTNATVLNNRVKRIMEKTNFHMNISFDSLQKETYEGIRINADFERVSENIKYFHQYCKERGTFFGISACAMQQNWKEMPDFINYCNELDIPVYFHTVFYPLHCSIRSMKPEQLAPMIEYYNQFDFPQANAVQKKNRTHYFDFVNQVKAFYATQTKIQTQTRTQPKTLGDVRLKVLEHLQNNTVLAEKVKAKKIEKIAEKFTEFESKLDPAFVSNSLTKIDISDPSLLDNIIFYFDRLPVSVLLVMAKSSFK
jgi:MoaA/NifB/PqqE/SkfB family radical SAM enzyme